MNPQAQQQQQVQEMVNAAQTAALQLESIHSTTRKCWPQCMKSFDSPGLTEDQKDCFKNCVSQYLNFSFDIQAQLMKDPNKVLLFADE